MKEAFALILVLTVAAVAAGTVFYPSHPDGGQDTTMAGSLFVSDAGQSHGGFEYTATYNVTLEVRGGAGVVTLVLHVGLGDVLTNHKLLVSGFQKTAEDLTMDLNGQHVVLQWTASDTVWNHAYDDFYIASWGSTAPPQEILGTISPGVFPGVYPAYYVELRLA